MPNIKKLESALPVAPLKLIAMRSAEELGNKVNEYLVDFRQNIHHSLKKILLFTVMLKSLFYVM